MLLGVVRIRVEGVDEAVLVEGRADGESEQAALAITAAALGRDGGNGGERPGGPVLPYLDRPRSLRPEEPAIRRESQGGRVAGGDVPAGRRLSLDGAIPATAC